MLQYWRPSIDAYGDTWQTAFGAEAQAALDRTVWLVSQTLSVPVSLVTVVEAERQVFQAQIGLKEPWASSSETLISHSFCQFCVSRDGAFVVEDSRVHPDVAENAAIDALEVLAYLGVPLHDPSGKCIGAVCAIDTKPRPWSVSDIAVVEALASAVEAEFRRCAELMRLRRSLAEARDEQRDHDGFLQTLGHELRSLLQGVSGGAQLLRKHVDAEGERLVEIIEHSADLMRHFTDDLLELDVLRRDKIQLEQAPFSPHALLRSVYELFRDRTGADVALRLDIAPGLPAAWYGDARRIEQVLINLVGNAAKFTRSGEIVLSAEVCEGRLILRVADTGPGVPEAARRRIFARFATGDAVPEGGERGFGLGLAICREVAERTGCELKLERTRCPGGSVFSLAVPAPAI
ncbi:MAG: GAF domain-containing sensor histidine kinase [Pseudomonadota bacterium]